jgi:hypothetical protein
MATFPLAPGAVDQSNYMNEIWSPLLQKVYTEQLFLYRIANTDYEGEISGQGKKVIIRTAPTPIIRDYVDGQICTYDDLTSDNIELVIDKGKYYGQKVRDITRFMADINYAGVVATLCGYYMKVAIETDIMGSLYSKIASTNVGTTASAKWGNINLGTTTTPVQVNKGNVVQVLSDMYQVLSDAKVPTENRYAIIPSWMVNMLKNSELKFAYATGDKEGVIRNGLIGEIGGFQIYECLHLPIVLDTVQGQANTKCTQVFAGHSDALTFASTVMENETMRAIEFFGNLLRGLCLYGWQLIKPEAMTGLYCTYAT